MPRAYWESDDKLADPLILVEPSPFEFDRILKAIKSADPQVYDMDIVSKMHHGSALVMPHRRLVLLTGELRRADDDHSAYLGNDIEKWDVDEVIKEAKYIHFSDWPVPKPWAVVPKPVIEQDAPACRETTPGVNDNCHQRDIWIGFYEDYAFRRKAVCDVDAEYLEKWGSTSDVFRAPF